MVRVGLAPPASSAAKAKKAGLVMIRRRRCPVGRCHHGPRAGPRQARLYKAEIAPHLTAGKMMRHGFNIRFKGVACHRRRRGDDHPEVPGHRVPSLPRRAAALPRPDRRPNATGNAKKLALSLSHASAAPARASSTTFSETRPISSASRPSSAAACAESWSRPASRPSSTRLTEIALLECMPTSWNLSWT